MCVISAEPVTYTCRVVFGTWRHMSNLSPWFISTCAHAHAKGVLQKNHLQPCPRSYAPRWDTYGRIFESLFANVKTAYVGGNHEVSSGGENWLNYK
jgi:hypothetical protein